MDFFPIVRINSYKTMRKLVVGLYYLAEWRKAQDEISSCITQEGEASRVLGPDDDRSYLARREKSGPRMARSNTVIKLPGSLT